MKQLNLKKLQNRLRDKFLKSGVKMVGPETIYFSKDTKIGKNVTIEPYVVFGLKVKIGNNVIIKSFSHLENCKVENKVDIGPYARIRPGTVLKEGSKIGNFVLTGGQVGINGHIKIGDRVRIAAKSGVFSDVADGESVMGNPAINKFKYIKKNFKKHHGKKVN